jgi:hypothetical protein
MINPMSSLPWRGDSIVADQMDLKSTPVRSGRFCFLCLVLLVMSGCGTVQVNTALDPAIDFRNYRTFNFKEPLLGSNPAYMSQVNQERVRNAIQQQLENRDLILAGQPDLLVSFYLEVTRTNFALEHPTAEGGSIGATMANYFGFYYKAGQSLNQQDNIPYHQGTLIIDLVDIQKNRVVWQGIVTDVLYPDQPDEQIQRRIRAAVRSAFKHFPR